MISYPFFFFFSSFKPQKHGVQRETTQHFSPQGMPFLLLFEWYPDLVQIQNYYFIPDLAMVMAKMA